MNKRFQLITEEKDWGTLTYFTLDDERISDEELEKLVNDQFSQIRNFKPIAEECIAATSELNGKLQSCLTCVGAYKEYLNRFKDTFDFRFWRGEDIFEFLEREFDKCCEYPLLQLEKRYGKGDYDSALKRRIRELEKENEELKQTLSEDISRKCEIKEAWGERFGSKKHGL